MIQVANAPCSWGVLEFALEGEAAGYAQVLDEMRATGYAGTELGDWGFMPTESSALSEALSERSLQLLGAFVPVKLAETEALEGALDVVTRTATLMRDAGFPHAFIVLADDNGTDPLRTAKAGRIDPEDGWSGAQWGIAGETINTLARVIRDQTGLRTVFHHHAAGFVETPDEVRTLLESTDPDLVGLVLDMGHYCFGGGDPMTALTEWRSRIWHVHYKDCDAAIVAQARQKHWDYFQSVAAGVFCKLGEGAVDFPAITSTLQASGYDDWIVVEQDVLPGMGAPKACAQFNRDYLKGLGL